MKKSKLNEQDFRGMVWQLAIGAWRMLPRPVQYWMDIEDLAAEGMMHLCQHLIPRYDPNKKYKPSTYVHFGVRNHLFNIVNSHRQKKRSAPYLLPLMVDNGRKSFSEHRREAPYIPPMPPAGAQQVESAQGLRYVYNHASPLLKRELRRLFSAGTQGQRQRLPVPLSQELKTLSERAHIGHIDFAKLSHAGFYIGAAGR